MTRLTNALTHKIIDAAIEKAGINRDRQDLQNQRYKLAEDLRVLSLGGAEAAAEAEKISQKMAKLYMLLPENIRQTDEPQFGRRRSAMQWMNLGGRRVTLQFSENDYESRMASNGFTLPGDHPLVIEFDRLCGVENDIQKRHNDLRDQLRASLSKFTTVKKLLEAWPEAKELLPETLEEAKPQLPAVQTSELNALIGLPSPE